MKFVTWIVLAIALAIVVGFLTLGWGKEASAAPLQPISHVVLVLEENHSSSSVTSSSMPFLFGQGKAFATVATYKNIVHPSLPNYLALTEGNTGDPVSLAGGDCGSSTSGCLQTDDNIFHQTAGLWKEWAQSEPANCTSHNSGNYVVHHAPPPFFTDLLASPGDGSCALDDIPFPVKSGQAMGTSKFIFVTPDNLHNGHSAALGPADTFLKTLLTTLKGRTAYTNGSTLIEVTFDETGGGNNLIYTALINPRLAGKGPIVGTYNHYSLLKLNEDLLGLPELGNAATATDLNTELALP
jgi:acid phosphatase